MPAKKRATKDQSFVSLPTSQAPRTPAPTSPMVEPITITAPQPKKKKFKIPVPSVDLSSHTALQKLRLAVLTIFALSTVAMLMVFINFQLAAVVIIISYLLLFGLLVKLLMVKHL